MSIIYSLNKKSQSRTLVELIGDMLEPVCAKRGFSSAAILSCWREIVGPDYQDVTLPQSIKWPKRMRIQSRVSTNEGGTLVIGVKPSHALFLQHEIGLVRDRINQFLGYQAISKIKIVQMPISTFYTQKRLNLDTLDEKVIKHVQQKLEVIDSQRLKHSLQKLGQSVLLQQNNN